MELSSVDVIPANLQLHNSREAPAPINPKRAVKSIAEGGLSGSSRAALVDVTDAEGAATLLVGVNSPSAVATPPRRVLAIAHML